MVKNCYKCGQTKSLENFYKNRARKDGVGTYCKPCERSISDPYQRSADGKAKATERARARRKKLIEEMGGACACCGENTYEFLQFDHINNDGAKHREKLGYTHLSTSEIRKNIEKFQILCANCNMAKFSWGKCPHTLALKRGLR